VRATYCDGTVLRHECRATQTIIDILATRGVQQSDVMGMLLFFIAIHPIVDGDWGVMYADNVWYVGVADDVVVAGEDLIQQINQDLHGRTNPQI
jgi:hypothetical protein